MSALFLRSMLERAAKTFAQTLLAVLGGGAVSIMEVPWAAALAVAGGAALISILTSIASARTSGDPDSPSLVPGVDR